MTDVAQALLVPRASPKIDVAAVYSALLIWDRVLVPSEGALGGASVPHHLDRFAEHGAVGLIDLPGVPSLEDGFDESSQFVQELSRHLPELKRGQLAILLSAADVGTRHGALIECALTACADVHAAPHWPAAVRVSLRRVFLRQARRTSYAAGASSLRHCGLWLLPRLPRPRTFSVFETSMHRSEDAFAPRSVTSLNLFRSMLRPRLPLSRLGRPL